MIALSTASAMQTEAGLIRQVGGMANSILQVKSDAPEALLAVTTIRCASGQPSHRKSGVAYRYNVGVQGTGVGLTLEDSLIPAWAEMNERYATTCFYEEQMLWASANQLEGPALDLDSVPRCSPKEQENVFCTIQNAVKTEPIRWVRGLHLLTGKVTWLPAVMIFSHAGWRGPQERFWLPISTGCAAHRDYHAALVSAICEVVERDAIALVWRQKLSLPEILLDECDAELDPYLLAYQRASANTHYRFFNATSDVGLPTVYGVQLAPHHPHARTTVACATAFTFDQAIAKVMKDLAHFKRAFREERKLHPDTSSFKGMLDGAAYMASPERASCFDFLMESPSSIALSTLRQKVAPLRTLESLVKLFRARSTDVYVVDLSTDEAIRSGLRVVRVLIPELQPLSLQTASQFLAHPRLYDAPLRMGYPVHSENELNSWPQPFA